MSDGTVHYETRHGVAIITIDRPEQRNALSAALCEQLHAAWLRFRDGLGERVAVLTATGRDFTVGADPSDPPANFFDAIPDVGVRLDKPVIAAVGGAVVGGGMAMVAMCDLCVAADDTRFLYPAARVDLDAGLIACLAARMAHKVAMESMFLGDNLGAARAYEIGFVNRVVPAGEQLTAALAMAATLAEAAPMVLATLKRLVRATLPRSPVERAQDARREIESVMRSTDMREGLAAFREKRKPSFRGS